MIRILRSLNLLARSGRRCAPAVCLSGLVSLVWMAGTPPVQPAHAAALTSGPTRATPKPTRMSSLNLTPTPAPNLTLFDFAVPKLAGRWRNIDDPVMGGVSRSRVGVSQGQLRFDGVVSLDNNGGFASVRSDRFASPVDASGFAAIRIRARGDGKTYILSLESASDPRLSYWQRFDTRAGEWTEAVLPLNGFEPQFRGFRPRGAVLLDPARLLSVSIYIADKQSGPFALDVAWMRAEGRAAPVPR